MSNDRHHEAGLRGKEPASIQGLCHQGSASHNRGSVNRPFSVMLALAALCVNLRRAYMGPARSQFEIKTGVAPTSLQRLENDILCPFPKDQPPKLPQVFFSFGDGQEMVAS